MRSSLPPRWLIAISCAAALVACSEVDRTRWKARFGDGDAQVALAAAYAQGTGVEKNAEEAERWYRKAAEQKRADAAGALARLYVSGEIASDPEQALHWFELEAESGGPDLQRALANRLYAGDGVAANPDRAFEWLQRAADAGSLRAQVELGNAHLNGRGTLRDFGKASEWYLRAAEAGNAEAQNNLGTLYM
ncbi:MAG: tetratricopeptide repeat protein, partial [Burkholderiales bacterium]